MLAQIDRLGFTHTVLLLLSRLLLLLRFLSKADWSRLNVHLALAEGQFHHHTVVNF
jgi:hypothetical protein